MHARFIKLSKPFTAAFAAAGLGACAHGAQTGQMSDAALAREAAALTMALAVRPGGFDPGVREAEGALAALEAALQAARAAPAQPETIGSLQNAALEEAPRLLALAPQPAPLPAPARAPFRPDAGFAAGRFAEAPASPAAQPRAQAFAVDLGRFESAALAAQVWREVGADDPSLTAGLAPRFSDAGGGAVILRAGPLANADTAAARCAAFERFGMACATGVFAGARLSPAAEAGG